MHPWFLGRSGSGEWEGVNTNQPLLLEMVMYVVIALVWGGQVAETSCPESRLWLSAAPGHIPGPPSAYPATQVLSSGE